MTLFPQPFSAIADLKCAVGLPKVIRLSGARTGNSLALLLAVAIFWASPVFAQGPLTNGFLHAGAITPIGDSDAWTFTANAGDSIVIRVGEISDTNGFAPRLRLINPAVVQQSTDSGSFAAEVIATATNSGTFTVLVDDAVGTNATGTYRLTLVKTSMPVAVAASDEGGPLTNGLLHTGMISTGDLDVWTFEANAGEGVVLRVGETADLGSFFPWLRVYGPAGGLIDAGFGSFAGEAALTAAQSGTYLVVIGDSNGTLSGTGTYQLTLAKTGAPVAVSSNDHGGPMTNGVMRTGIISRGDLDVWTVIANAGETLIARIGEITDTNSFAPWVRIYSPAGPRLGSSFSPIASELSVVADQTGEYLIVVADGNGSYSGMGAYRLTLVRTGDRAYVGPGDEGGALQTLNPSINGVIERGDIDAFSFSACPGEKVLLQVNETLDGGSFSPSLRLYAPDGGLVANLTSVTNVQLNTNAASAGRYMVVVGDGNASLSGVGSYQLTVNGLSDDLRFCPIAISGTNVVLNGVGGNGAASFQVYTSTNLAAPLASWRSVATNQFSVAGAFSYTNQLLKTDRQRFFRISAP